MQINDRVLVRPLPKNNEDQRRNADDRENQDEMRLEPILALSLIENYLESSKSQGYKAEANVIDVGFAQLPALQIGRVLDEARGEQDGENAYRNVDEEDPTPGKVVGDPSAQSRADRRSGHHRHSVHCESHAAFCRRKRIGENCLLARLQSAAACTLENAADDQRGQIRGQPAQK